MALHVTKQDDDAAQPQHPEDVFGRALPPRPQTTEVLQPIEQALDLPSALVAPELAPVLGIRTSLPAVRRDQLHPETIGQLGVELVRIITCRQSGGWGGPSGTACRAYLQPVAFMRASTSNPKGDRKTALVRDRQDFDPPSMHSRPPFLLPARSHGPDKPEGLFGYANFCRCAGRCYEVGTCVLWHKTGFQDGIVWTEGTRTTFQRTKLSCSSYPNSSVSLIHFGLYAPDTPTSVR